ncbi:putative proton-dependent oligopeptide transporter family, MFS transporter superfamily [Helianthus annuus]|uniref:Proton-dependent oligopeptide transporter family, major facilitator superfamily n=1 Tax=Helianthus annuus TaxID=4232 RepID=A0A9K3P4N8_HELAN|nr:protein NRT1/ PTR FAMILY 1.2-like [Helianthus annuus]KAF5823911.1 putative proton-dependent oligopeptide transporter family, major facilitator superfamily [Helianthus annuus]KAJ0628571.1 putative proton-dependent oligopeptide transporter family, MFS transporter superfamily [Helianthus annuus]KAJ0949975.1 putative proton-dependent oligopeptide transporter family, MFS transporter superfamily [Helianthus annuus]
MEEEDSNIQDQQTKSLLDNNHDHKGGMRTMPFIIVNEAFEKVASYGLLPNMILYLTEVYKMQAVTGATVLYIWSAFSNGLSLFGAFVSDSYLGPFRVIAFGSLSTLLGMSLLWLTSMVPQLTPSCNQPDTSCSLATPTQLVVLFSSFGLMSIGTGCIRPCCITFGADQLKHVRTGNNNQRLIDSYFNWYYASVSMSAFFAFTVVVYIQDQLGWRVGFAVPVFIMACSAIVFLIGSPLYVKVKVKESPYSGFIQVLVMAFKNRRIHLRPDDCYNHSNEMDRVELTDNLRFLNKACVVRDMNIVSTVEQVESLKSVIQMVPVWSTGILLFTNVSLGYPTLQAKTMNRHVTSWFEIPAGSYSVFMVLTLTIWVAFYDRILVPILAKYTHDPRGLTTKTRMGIGLLISIIAMMVSAIVESIRRDLANSNTPVHMSAMWLVPQYALLGLAEAFNVIALMEYCYSELPKSMSSVAMAVFTLSSAVAGLLGSLLVNIVDSVTSQGGNVSWLSTDINEGHVDYYYWLLSFLNLVNFLYFLICCRVQRSSSPPVYIVT